MKKLFANPIFTALICFAATFVALGLRMLIYHSIFNICTALPEAILFAIIGFICSATDNSGKKCYPGPIAFA